MIDKAAEAGAEYYCIDAGWYADGGWWEIVGEWQPRKRSFPNIKRVFAYIRERGMIPGIWLEIEVMGIHCPLVATWGSSCGTASAWSITVATIWISSIRGCARTPMPCWTAWCGNTVWAISKWITILMAVMVPR